MDVVTTSYGGSEVIPLNDLSEYDGIAMNGVRRVMASGNYISGYEVRQFEAEFSDYMGHHWDNRLHLNPRKPYCAALSNGTTALELALRILASPEKRVLVPAMTFVATAEAVLNTGNELVVGDIDPITYTLDPTEVKRHKADIVIPVHLYGQACDMASIIRAANDALMIEDCAQAHGAVYDGYKVGMFGDIGCFSFYPNKVLGAIGDAGCVVSGSSVWSSAIKAVSNHGRLDEKYNHKYLGTNARMDEIQAAVLRDKLVHLDKWIYQRQMIAARYNEVLEDVPHVVTPKVGANRNHVFYQYVIMHPDRNALRAYLKDSGIYAGIHYPQAINEMKQFMGGGYSCPVAEKVSRECLSLPIWPSMPESIVGTVCNAIRKFSPVKVSVS